MRTIGEIMLQSDESGMITLQCDRCKSRFKLECDYLNNEFDGDICCPICGISNSANTFLPEEVIEEAKQVAIMEAEEIAQKVFKGLNSKDIRVKTPPVSKHNRYLAFKNKDYDMQVITVRCCKKEIALMSVDASSGYYCPYCGRITK